MDALILAGGKGTRLKPLIADVPKPLALVAGRPFLDYLVSFLKASGIVERIIVSAGYKADQIHDWAVQRSKDFPIICVEERKPLGTGGAILHTFDEIKAIEPLLVMNGDSFIELDLGTMAEQHREENLGMTLAVIEHEDVSCYGEVLTSDKTVTGFIEKGNIKRAGWINAGIYMINPKALKNIERVSCSFERDIIPKLLSSGIGAFYASGKFIDIGTPESYAQAAKIIEH